MNKNTITIKKLQKNGLRQVFDTILQYKKTILLITILGALSALGATFLIDKKYTAYSKIIIDRDENKDTTSQSYLASNPKTILSEIEVLKSHSLILKTIKHLRLTKDPEFNIKNQTKEDILNIKNKPNETNIKNNAVLNFLNALQVSTTPDSAAITISFTSNNAEKSVLIVNTLITEYTKQRINERYETQQKLRKWLNKRINYLHHQVAKTEQQLSQYRQKNKASLPASSESLNEKYITAQKKYLAIKLQLQKETNLHYQQSNNVLIKKERSIQKELTELSKRYGPKHPLIIQKKRDLQKIKQQKFTPKSSLKDQLYIAKKELEKTAAARKNITPLQDQNDIKNLYALKSDLTASRHVLNQFLENRKKNIDKDMIQNTGVRVISYATPSTITIYPNKKALFIRGLVLSFLFGLFFAFLNKKLYNKFKTEEDLENSFGVACLGHIPLIRKEKNKNIVQQILTAPSSKTIELIRNITTNLNIQQPKVISILSATKREGKTTTALLISAMTTKSGKRTILIDANLKSPSIHKTLSQDNNHNLVDYLTNQSDLEDIIYKDPDTGADIIFGSAIPHNSFNILSLEKLDTLVETLRNHYDLIILNSSPCSKDADARLIEQLSDFTLFTVKYNTTTDEVVMKSIKPFINRPSPTLGFILTHTK